MAQNSHTTNENHDEQPVTELEVLESRGGKSEYRQATTTADTVDGVISAMPVTVAEKESGETQPRTRPNATGPRTARGKERSSRNSMKYGDYSKRLVLKNESKAQYEALRKGLWEDFQPQSTLEAEILNDIVWNRWTRHREIAAHNSRIAEQIEFSEFEMLMQQQARVWELGRRGSLSGGMLKPGCNLFVLREGIERLKEIRLSVETHGLTIEAHRKPLTELYGTDADGSPPRGVFIFYVLAAGAEASQAEDKSEDKETTAVPDKFKKRTLEVLDEEIENLTALEIVKLDMEVTRTEYRIAQALVPSQTTVDRQLRLETHSTRELARLLTLFDYARRTDQRNCGGGALN